MGQARGQWRWHGPVVSCSYLENSKTAQHLDSFCAQTPPSMGCANCKKSGDAEKAEEVEKVDEIDTGPKYNDDWSTYYESEPETVKPVPQGSTDGSVLFFWSPDYDSKRKKGDRQRPASEFDLPGAPMVSPTSTQHSKQRADVLPAAPRTGPTGNWSTNEETNSPKPLKVGWSGDDDIHEIDGDRSADTHMSLERPIDLPLVPPNSYKFSS